MAWLTETNKLLNEAVDEDENEDSEEVDVDEDEHENEDNALKALGDRYERLTVQIIRDQFWDPVTKKGLPITFFDIQDYESFDDDDLEWETTTPTGNLIKMHNSTTTIIKDWLSTSTNGPYKDQGETGDETGDILYFLEFENSQRDSMDLQIGWCGSNNMVNNYMTIDALDGVDCWIKKLSD